MFERHSIGDASHTCLGASVEKEPGRVLSTVLFVDIVRSTEKAALLGDRRWNEVLSHYYAATVRPSALSAWRSGPGFMRASVNSSEMRSGVSRSI